MTNHNDPNPMLHDAELGALVRLLADGEATPQQREAFRARRDRLTAQRQRDLDALVESERALRAATARVMRDAAPAAPASLRTRVQAAARAADERGPASPVLFRFVRANWAFAAAAGILLALVAGMLVLSTVNRPPVWSEQDGPRASLVRFLASEHTRCSEVDSGHAERKLPVRDSAAALDLVSRFMPNDPQRVLDAAGPEYTLLGAGPCAVPGGGASIHLVFTSTDETCAPVSVFLQDCSSRSPETVPGEPVSLGRTATGSALRMFRAGADGCLVYVAAPTDADADRIVARLLVR